MEFNNGFVVAIGLFLEHKWQFRELKGKGFSDLRLYCATDHLFDMEIPNNISEELKERIEKWREECFKNRLNITKNYEVGDKLFEEGEDILKEIDEEVFKTKEVEMNYR